MHSCWGGRPPGANTVCSVDTSHLINIFHHSDSSNIVATDANLFWNFQKRTTSVLLPYEVVSYQTVVIIMYQLWQSRPTEQNADLPFLSKMICNVPVDTGNPLCGTAHEEDWHTEKGGD